MERLHGSFKWELRTAYFAPVFVVVFAHSPQAGRIFGALILLAVILMDSLFSVTITQIFIRPISRVLGQGNTAARRSAAFRDLEKTKHATLFGSTLAVFSSTVFYINFILAATVKDPFQTNPWMAPLVFAINLDSILNDVSMLFVSGVLKNISFKSVTGTTASASAKPVSDLAHHHAGSVVEREPALGTHGRRAEDKNPAALWRAPVCLQLEAPRIVG